MNKGFLNTGATKSDTNVSVDVDDLSDHMKRLKEGDCGNSGVQAAKVLQNPSLEADVAKDENVCVPVPTNNTSPISLNELVLESVMNPNGGNLKSGTDGHSNEVPSGGGKQQMDIATKHVEPVPHVNATTDPWSLNGDFSSSYEYLGHRRKAASSEFPSLSEVNAHRGDKVVVDALQQPSTSYACAT